MDTAAAQVYTGRRGTRAAQLLADASVRPTAALLYRERAVSLTRVTTCAVVAALALSAPATATSASTTSAPEAAVSARGVAAGGGTQLAWSRSVDLDFSAFAIVVRDAGRRHVRVLTRPGPGVQDIDPKISPDGERVLFERDYPDGRTRIGVVGTDGGPVRLLDLGCVDPCVGDQVPVWSPDGRQVLFTRVTGPFDPDTESFASAALWQADLNGRHARRLSPRWIDGTFEDYRASFAPSGYLVFIRVRNADVALAVFRMDVDGRHVRRLTPWSLDADLADVSPATSGPTEDLVVFETFGHGPPEGKVPAVATVPAGCAPTAACRQQIRYLTSPAAGPVQAFNPAWSPDGRRIAYVRFSFVAPGPPEGDIWTLRWDGTDRQRFTRSPLFEFRPDWGPSPAP